MKKLLCGIMAIFMAVSMVSCGDGEESSQSGKVLVSDIGDNVNIKEEDMPYGATTYELSESNDDHVKYITCFDKRYFGGDDEDNPDYSEVYAVHDYIAALNTNDHDAFKALHYDGYLDSACKSSGYGSADEYIDSLYNSLNTYLGEGFEINYIDISACLSESDSASGAYIGTVDQYLENIGVLDKVTSKKVIEVGGYTCYKLSEGGAYQLTNHMESIIIGVYTIDGQVYIV